MGRYTRIVAAASLTVFGVPGAAAGPPTPSHDLRVLDQEHPRVVESGSTFSQKVMIANDGSVAWAPDDGCSLAYHWLDESGGAIVWDGRRTPFETAVHPGDEVSMTATVEAPLTPGRFGLVWDVVCEGKLWVSEVDPTPVEPAEFDVEAGHAFSVVSGRSPRVMVVGGEAAVRIAVRNEGTLTWPSGGATSLSYHWLDRDGTIVNWEGRRVAPAVPVAPGEIGELSVVVEAPSRAGVFRLQWDMVEEGVCWFSERTARPPPSDAVLVVTDVLADPTWWAVFSLLTAALAVSVNARGRPPWVASWLAVADVFWCAGSLVVKQGSVLVTAGTAASGSGRALMAGAAAAMALVLLWLPGRWRPWLCWLVAAVGTFVLWGDTLYLRFFGDLPAPGAMAGAGQLGDVEASVRSLMELRDVWLWADLLPGAVLMMASLRLRRRAGARSRTVAAILLVAVFVIGGGAATRLARSQPDLLRQVFRRTQVARQIGVLNLHLLDLGAWSVGKVAAEELSPERYEAVVEWFQDRAPLRAGVGQWFGAGDGFNLVMIQVESLQGFVIGLEVNGQEVTPFLNRWAEDGLWFSNVTDQTAQGRSSDSELASQVSLLPPPGGAAAFRFADRDFTGLAEVLTDRGYTTLSAVPYDGSFWNRRVTHPAFGYATSLFVEDFAAGDRVGWGLSDRDFFQQVGRRLTAIDGPFAAYLLTLSLHHPFEGFPKRLEVLDVGRWDGMPFGNFLHTMHFFDTSLASFMTVLERSGLADSTVIAVWGDHDAGFPWRPEIASVMGQDHDPEGWYLSQEVPLLIRVPGAQDLHGERTTVAGHVDVAPTLLALLGVDPAAYAFVGRNLLGSPGDSPVVGEYGCWRTGRLLYLQGDGSLEGGDCIDLQAMASLPAGACAEGFAAAAQSSRISADVLEFDLQGRLHDELAGAGSIAP